MNQRFCLGFEIHQPYRLKKAFVPGSKNNQEDLMERYFDGANKEILLRVSNKCYGPATSIILEKLDEGFACAFSISGVLIEQMERWAPDILDLFVQAASHKNVEMIGQTYFHSMASLFWTMDEFCNQVNLHRELIKDVFHVEPVVFENTEFILDNRIAATVRELGYKACLTEGVDHILEWRSPNHLYQCAGLPVIMRNFKLSDDIAFRFTCRDWAEWPLTADRYASWISKTPGDFIPVFIDYETLGEHYWVESGILEFLRHLGPEMRNSDVKMIKPSEILSFPVQHEFSIPYPISWADAEKDGSAWIENRKQKNAFRAVQRAESFCENKHLWRCFQISDHFYYMSCKYGSCGEVHNYFSHQPEHEAFITYMDALADFEEREVNTMEKKKFLFPLRSLSVDDAFYFSSPVGYTGHVAFDLDQFAEMLQIVPADSISFHHQKGDFASWCRYEIKDEPLARSIEQAKTRQELILAADTRRFELWAGLR
ncbi:glycoside hydrolase family 57 protein [Methanospirillum stamsii]|uniref:Alpha-amlyase n=1 Tax=Methanospirillum stamsii TaxID=1277351 RepID=A0A2V2N8R1_9EURY|nr:glycoside hydrolase family 57 protein [Methanospirillum stamsii]PWR75070.1 alpha-amlyase [Methanospirillum stamsii]